MASLFDGPAPGTSGSLEPFASHPRVHRFKQCRVSRVKHHAACAKSKGSLKPSKICVLPLHKFGTLEDPSPPERGTLEEQFSHHSRRA